ncbi:probable RNA-directed DNA polymerase from transposon X-element [Trichonephila clavipes]|nr:probable RNA-directed DNA polymerase from transposon X-element [Trichonephila clavipes]
MEIDHHLDNGPVMEQSLPSSTASLRQSSRPGNPLVSYCQRRLELTIMKQYSFGIEYVPSAINGFKINNLEGCSLDVHQPQLLADHEKYLQVAVKNKLTGLENVDLRTEPIAGTSSDTTATNVTQVKNTTMNNTANVNTTNLDTNTNNLPPPVMLRITLTFRDQMKTLNDLMPKIQSKKTDLETILQINSNCAIFGDFNAPHNTWNCSRNSTRGIQLKNFSDIVNLEIAFHNSPTRYGYNSSNNLDFALISNFNFPYNIESISELSSDHNPVILNFSLSYSIHKDNSRAITTCWSAFKKNIKSNIHLSDFTKINNPPSLEEKIGKLTDAVCSAHQLSSKPIANKTHCYTLQHIKELITRNNRTRKLFQRTLNPIHKTEANRLKALVKRELKIHSQNTWNAKLNALETQDNSLWHTQKHFSKKRSNIPKLIYASGIASNDEQKANLIANNFEDNYTEKKRPGHRLGRY